MSLDTKYEITWLELWFIIPDKFAHHIFFHLSSVTHPTPPKLPGAPVINTNINGMYIRNTCFSLDMFKNYFLLIFMTRMIKVQKSTKNNSLLSMFKVELFFVDICFPLAIGHFLGHSYKFYKNINSCQLKKNYFLLIFMTHMITAQKSTKNNSLLSIVFKNQQKWFR